MMNPRYVAKSLMTEEFNAKFIHLLLETLLNLTQLQRKPAKIAKLIYNKE